MMDKYLEITYRKGKMLAAYLYLPREIGEKSIRTEKFSDGILIDYGKENHPIGVEIVDPKMIDFDIINRVISKLRDYSVQEIDFAPLLPV
ncbi:MAG: DUF2283 domain-containing protein [Candidatus Zhuqueibacterota bacterium]